MGDLDPDELDKISNLYSTGEFLDTIIVKVSDWKFDYQSNIFYEKVPLTERIIKKPQLKSIPVSATEFSPLELESKKDSTLNSNVSDSWFVEKISKSPISFCSSSVRFRFGKSDLDFISSKVEAITRKSALSAIGNFSKFCR